MRCRSGPWASGGYGLLAGQRGFFHDEWTAGDGDEWLRIRVPATGCPRIVLEVLAEERRKLGEQWFRQEYLCEFTESEGYVFSRESIEATLRYDLAPLFPWWPGMARPLQGAGRGVVERWEAWPRTRSLSDGFARRSGRARSAAVGRRHPLQPRPAPT